AAPPEARPAAGGVEQARQRFTELRRDRGRSLCGAQRSHEIAHALTIPSPAGHAVIEQRAPRHVVRDELVAIPVSPDPRPELEERGDVEVLPRVGLPQGALELFNEL